MLEYLNSKYRVVSRKPLGRKMVILEIVVQSDLSAFCAALGCLRGINVLRLLGTPLETCVNKPL